MNQCLEFHRHIAYTASCVPSAVYHPTVTVIVWFHGNRSDTCHSRATNQTHYRKGLVSVCLTWEKQGQAVTQLCGDGLWYRDTEGICVATASTVCQYLISLRKATPCFIVQGAGMAQWLEHRTRDWKVAGSNPCWNGGRIFFSRVDFLCWLLFRYPFHPRVTTVARKKSRSFCQKCRWQVTAKHAYTLRMWILLNRASALVTTCP